MADKVHYITGLPRSGTTLLAAILRQNPRFLAGITSPLCDLFSAAIRGMSGREAVRFISADQRARVLRGLIRNFYEASSTPVVFDSSRGWTNKLAALCQLQPDVKVICMVRNVAWVMDSIERLLRRNALLASKMFDDAERTHVYARCDALSGPNRLVGGAWSSTKEAYYSEEAERLLVVDYEFLARTPALVMPLIYAFLGEPAFDHDFTALDYAEPEFDEDLATPDLHRVRPSVSFIERKTILPPDLFARFDALSFWTDTDLVSRANVVRARTA